MARNHGRAPTARIEPADEQPVDGPLGDRRVRHEQDGRQQAGADEVRADPPAEPSHERAEVEAGPRPRPPPDVAAGATRASATSAPTSRIGYSQISGKTCGATRATNAEASAPPADRIR